MASTNGIVEKGNPYSVGEFVVENATSMYPGRLVKKGTADTQIVVNDGSSPIGWLAYEDSAAYDQPSDRDTAYAEEDVAVVIRGHMKIRAHLASGESVSIGDPLVPTADGELKAATALTIDSGTVAVTSSAANGAIISGDIGDAPIVAYAAETVDASGGATAIWVYSVI